MKRLIAFLLLLVLALPLTACDSADGIEFTCDEIIAAYESAGYTVDHSHNSLIEGGECTLYIYESKEGSENNEYICIEIFENEEYKILLNIHYSKINHQYFDFLQVNLFFEYYAQVLLWFFQNQI